MSSAKILLVDDDKNLVELVKMRLESANYKVTAAFREDDLPKRGKNRAN